MKALINRRGFVKAASTMAAGAALYGLERSTTPSLGAAPAKKRTLRKAVHLGMVDGSMPVLDKFKLAKDCGFDGLEIDSPNPLKREEILRACESTGLKIANVTDSVHWQDPLSDPRPEVRTRGLEGLKTALRDAKALQCGTVLLVPAVVNKEIAYDQAYARSQAAIREVLPLAEELGVKVAIENVWNQFLLSPLEAARYVDEFRSPAVGWHFDAGNIINYGWPEQWIRILGRRIATVHVKEFSRAKRDKEGLWKGFEVELLEGDNDWPAIMKALDEVGFQGWMIAEIAGGEAQRLKFIAERMDRILAS